MTIESALSVFATPHIIAGAVALLFFWLAAISRKGSLFHRRCGQIYLIAMLIVILSAVPLSALLFLRGQLFAGLFMAYLVVLVSLTCRNSWRAVTFKRDFSRYAGAELKMLATATGLAGLLVVGAGLKFTFPILIGFGAVGIILAWSSFRLVRNGPADGRWWLREHFGAMIGNGVATHIAFLQIGLQRALPALDLGMLQNLAWFGPLAVAAIAGSWLSRRYGRPAGIQ